MTYDEALTVFLNGCQEISDKHAQPDSPYRAILGIWTSTKYDKIVRREVDKATGKVCDTVAIHCFIDKTTGNVFKARTWHKPVSWCIVGNIFKPKNSLRLMGPYGPISKKKVKH